MIRTIFVLAVCWLCVSMAANDASLNQKLTPKETASSPVSMKIEYQPAKEFSYSFFARKPDALLRHCKALACDFEFSQNETEDKDGEYAIKVFNENGKAVFQSRFQVGVLFGHYDIWEKGGVMAGGGNYTISHYVAKVKGPKAKRVSVYYKGRKIADKNP